MSEDDRPDLRTHARFHGPPPAGMESLVDADEIAATQRRSKGPAELAVHLRTTLAQRIDGVSEDPDDVDLGTHIGRFTVRHDRRAVRVLVVWYPLPRHRFWVLSILPQRSLRRGRRARDRELALEVRSHLDGILSVHPEISGVVWTNDGEAEAYSL
jgi:hypothetical protein